MTDTDNSTGQAAGGAAIRRLVFVLLLTIAIFAAAAFMWSRHRDASAAAAEREAQKPEVEECKRRLQAIHAAWVRYTADHKGRQPASCADLVPKYISDPKMLVCPTAERWMARGSSMESGVLTVGKKQWPVTYGFLVFTASYPREVAKHGDSTVMVSCDAHQEGMYRSVFHHGMQSSVFDTTERDTLPEAVRNTKQIVLLKNGTVEMQDARQ